MNLQDFYTETQGGIIIKPSQGSAFAKYIAGDFNPAHDENTKIYCHPGDLLFSIIVSKYGISSKTKIKFKKAIKDDKVLTLSDLNGKFKISNGKTNFVTGTYSGTNYSNVNMMNLAEKYVQFSGQIFPEILVPLLEREGLMIALKKPFVAYQSMNININGGGNKKNPQSLELKLASSDVKITKKTRALVSLNFDFECPNVGYGRANKKIQLLGLKPFQQTEVDSLIKSFELRKKLFKMKN